jgi:hypothetical protein
MRISALALFRILAPTPMSEATGSGDACCGCGCGASLTQFALPQEACRHPGDHASMPLCLSKRHSAEELEMQSHERAERMRVQADVGVAWVLSFLSTYRKKTYCLYEATPDGPAAPAEKGRHPSGSGMSDCCETSGAAGRRPPRSAQTVLTPLSPREGGRRQEDDRCAAWPTDGQHPPEGSATQVMLPLFPGCSGRGSM